MDDNAVIDFEDDSLSYLSFHIGDGLEYQFRETAEIVLGVDLGKRYWQEIEVTGLGSTVKIDPDDQPISGYVGINFRI